VEILQRLVVMLSDVIVLLEGYHSVVRTVVVLEGSVIVLEVL
jgi:hypothetical protein